MRHVITRLAAYLPWPDTLFARLAFLLTVVVIGSHALALTLMFELSPPPPPPAHAMPPPLPSLQPIVPFGSDRQYVVPKVLHVQPDPSLNTPPPQRQPRPLWTFAIDVSVRLLALLVAAWFAARWLTQPIRQLATAARDLGRDIHRPPLPVKGLRECREASQVFNQMQEQLCQQLQDRDRLVAAVSHDLRTPLTRLRLRTELLNDPQAAHEMEEDIAEMEAMIQDTLDYLRGQAQGPQMVRVHIQALLESVVDDYAFAGIAIPLHGSAAPILGQPGPLRRCIDNLLGNALRYGGGAEVLLQETESTVLITVRDHGPGLPETALKEVMQPFVRMEASRHRHHGGVGLGLSIARDIALRHGGQLTLHNADDGGLCAVLELPRIQSQTTL